MSIVKCATCGGTGMLCGRRGCTRRRTSGNPHRECHDARPRKCPDHTPRRVYCDACGAGDLEEWHHRESWVLCDACAEQWDVAMPKFLAVFWDSFLSNLRRAVTP